MGGQGFDKARHLRGRARPVENQVVGRIPVRLGPQQALALGNLFASVLAWPTAGAAATVYAGASLRLQISVSRHPKHRETIASVSVVGLLLCVARAGAARLERTGRA